MRYILPAFLIGVTSSACTAQSAALPPLLRSGETMSGQPLFLPRGRVELVASVRELARGGSLPVHKHPWPRYVYVETGRMRVLNHDTGLTREFAAGEVLVEAIDQWHEGHVVGDAPVRLVVFDQVPPGRTNMVLKEPGPSKQ